ncbi:MAG: 50S ribosomal protein L13 [Acidobacteria bacterium]|nr:50S ribosomal protein L13 [Acidobacteriota bacterium]
MSTFFPSPEDVDRKWYVVDAAGLPIGRVSSFVASILMGKRNPMYTPHLDTGDHVVVINADQVVYTGRKSKKKVYRRHSMRPGGLTEVRADKMLEKHPTRPLELAVKGMLPKTKMGRKMYTKLHVYAGPEHVHQAQKPESIAVQA